MVAAVTATAVVRAATDPRPYAYLPGQDSPGRGFLEFPVAVFIAASSVISPGAPPVRALRRAPRAWLALPAWTVARSRHLPAVRVVAACKRAAPAPALS